MNKILKGAQRCQLYGNSSRLNTWLSYQIKQDFDICIVEEGSPIEDFYSMLEEEYGLQEVLNSKSFPYTIKIEDIPHLCFALKGWTAKEPDFPLL